MRFGRVDVDPFEGGERRRFEPRTVGKERVAAEVGDRGFEMQAAGDGNGDDFVIVGREDGGELVNDPAFLYQDVLVQLKGEAAINNGQPSLHALCLAALGIRAGETVVQHGGLWQSRQTGRAPRPTQERLLSCWGALERTQQTGVL